MMLYKVRLTSVLFGALLSVAAGIHASADAREINEIPDTHHIKTTCNGIHKRDELYILSKSPSPKNQYSTVAQRMIELCDQFSAGQISADSWLTDFALLEFEVREANHPCNFRNCYRVIIPPTKPLPTNFTTYVLFLFPSSHWLAPETKNDVKAVERAFSAFGDAIGNPRAAIWFSSSPRSSEPDIHRAKFYCDKFGLDYNDGPIILVSSKRPDLLESLDQVVVVKLRGIDSSRVVDVLNVLEQDLRRESTIRTRKLLFEEVRQRVLSAVKANQTIAEEIAKGAIGILAK
ncbi:hypothetical protein [Accumulibacter sp.]|jgi:hypothetical protein|uniref:hypothetical protein n=1 Tax=Accumulibacter sp. TaxID=2053492 RepID=UPI001ACD220D|nr:hypothetical protein [Accumulibacter sp.]MBN8454353.1 hypothetical protein [Accumulibacter sp.]